MVADYVLGGRGYVSAAHTPTFAQRGYLMGVVRANGLDRVIAKDGDLLGAILSAGCASTLLAGLLVESGTAWTRDAALTNATFFDGLTDEADHDQLLSALEALLAGFFVNREGSSTPSPTSSGRRRKTSAEKRAAHRARKQTSDSVAGPTSAPPSPSTPAPASTT